MYIQHQTCSRYTEYRDIYMYIHMHIQISYICIYSHTYVNLCKYGHIVCALRGCVVLFSTFKNEDRQFRQKCCSLFHTYQNTYIHTYILSVNKYDICRCVCDKADPSVGAGVLQWHRVDTVACYEFITQGKGRENSKRCHRRAFTRS